MRTISITPRATLAATVAALALAAAPAAHADSIAYVKNGDVWLSTGDGSRQFQVTSRGGYTDVTQADDGTLVALNGVRLQKLSRTGDVLADFATPVSDTRPAGSRTFYGPFDIAISPNGQKVAYDWYYMTQSQNPGCLPPQCVTTINEGGTGYSRTDRATDWDEPGFAKHSGWRNPAWVDDATTILSDPTHVPNDDVVVDVPEGRGQNGFLVKGWFSDTAGGNPHTSGGEVSRDRAKAAFATGANDDHLTLYRIGTFPTTFRDGEADAGARPEICYRYGAKAGARFGTPTFAPDGTQVAVATGDGIEVATVPSFAGGCTTDGASAATRMLIPGGTNPDWGPADVPPARTGGSGTPATPGGTPAGPGPGAGSGPGTGPGAGTPGSDGGGCAATGCPVRLRVVSRTLARALASGLDLRLTGGARSATVRIVAKVAGRVVATGSARTTGAGTASVRIRFDAASRRRLRGRRTVTLAVSGAGAAPLRVTLRA